MNYEAIITVFCELCTIFILIDWWRRIFKSYRVANKIREIYVDAKAIGSPSQIGAVRVIAEEIGVDLNEL